MNSQSKQIVRSYLILILMSTLASSLIWGINTLFLLDAGLTNGQAFLANAFFTVGQVLFEIPTGIVADSWGRRISYLLGAATLFTTTVMYYILWQNHAPIWQWAVISMLLGLGFTFFSGAVEAWLVDALEFSRFKGKLDDVFAKGQVIMGIGMLSGAVLGGVIAQITNLGVPYILRAVLLLATFIAAWILMHDIGFTPDAKQKTIKQMRSIFNASITHGIKNPPVRWLMLAAPFSGGVGFYAFYAMQPYLLELYGNPQAYSIAGLAAAFIAGAQIFGGLLVPFIRKQFNKRTTVLAVGVSASGAMLLGMGLLPNFVVVLLFLVFWAMVFAAISPIRQAYLNGLIPSKQRATVLSFDSLMSSTGGVVAQPVLGRSADVYSYATSYIFAGAIQLMAFPFMLLARKQNAPSDTIMVDTANK